MKTIATVLLVLVAIIGMAGPVLGAEAGSSTGASADWDVATQYSYAWAQDDEYTSYPDAYADAGTSGMAEGYTISGSSAAAGDDWAGAGTGGYSEVEGWFWWGGSAETYSETNAESWNEDGDTDTDAGSYAIGDNYVEAAGGSESYWGIPIYSESWAYGYVYDYDGWNGWTESGGSSYAEVP